MQSAEFRQSPRFALRALIATVIAAFAIAIAAQPAFAEPAQTVDVAVSQVTGTAPFDSATGSGNDISATDDIVRSNDSVTYLVQLNVNDPGAGSSTASNVTVTQTLPVGMTWSRLPATCLASVVVPPSSISPDGRTITCNIGSVPTGQAVTVSLTAQVNEMTDAVTLVPDADSVSVKADDSNTATTTPDPVTVSSLPRVDMVKSAPQVTETNYGGKDGFFLKYPVRVEIPNFGGRGLIGYEPPAPAMSLKDDFSNVSPNAEFVSCGPDSKGTWTCPAAGSPSPIDIDIDVTDPNLISSGTLSSTTVTVFIPKSDLPPNGSMLTTINRIEDLIATDLEGNAAVGEITTNNEAKVALSLDPGNGFSIYKHYIDVTAPGRYIPGGPNVDRNGFASVGAGQVFQAEVRTSAANAAAGYPSIASCDVIDTTSQKVTLAGPASSSSHGKGSPAWITSNSVTGGLPLKAGVDFVLEYSTDATSIDASDATRWAALRSTGCSSGTWTSTPPADEAAANAVTRVRLRFLVTPPLRFTLNFAVNLTAKTGDDGRTIANFASHDVGSGWVPSTYDPATHKGSRGDRLYLTAAQVKLAKDILDPVTPANGIPTVLPGEEIKFGLRPQVFIPSQSVAPTVVTATNVKVVDVLPAGTTLVTTAGREPSPTPASIKVNADRTTTITWNLGTLTSNSTPPTLTYWAKVSNTASGSKVNRAIVTSPDDYGSPSTIPTSGTDPHYAARTINIDSLGGIQVDKAVEHEWVEPRDTVSFAVTYANLDPVDRDAMDVVDVLPFNGDGKASGPVPGRNPASSFHGSVKLKSVTVNDGELVRYTDAAPAAVYALYNPSASGAGHDALPAGKAWCTADQIAASESGCPASISASTAIRVTRLEELGAKETATFSYEIETPGSRSSDVYSNTASLRSASLVLGALSPTKVAHVVANAIGDFVWKDLNRNGRQDRGEPGVAGVSVILEGTDKHGRKIRVTTRTDSKGRYLFRGFTQASQNAGIRDLASGRYRITFVKSSLPKGTAFTKREVPIANNTNNSNADPASGRTSWVDIADPTPGRVDSLNPNVDAGIQVIPTPPRKPVFTG